MPRTGKVPRRVAALCLAVAAAACGGGGGEARTRVLVYSAHGKDLLTDVETRFEAANPHADVVWLDMGADQCFDRVRGERENPQCDVWWGGPEFRFSKAAEAGLLAVHRPSWADKAPPATHDPEWRWAGCFTMPQVIAYHRDLVKEPPGDWDDLADPKWKGRVVLRDPAQSGGMKAALGAIFARALVRDGKTDAAMRWFRDVAANRHSVAPSPARVFDAFRRDDTGLVTIWNLTDVLYQAHGANPPVPFAFVVPLSGAPTFVDGIALVARGSRGQNDAAAAFYEFATSVPIAEMLDEKHYRLPVRTDVPPPSWIAELVDAGLAVKRMDVDWSVVGKHVDQWQRDWEDALGAERR